MGNSITNENHAHVILGPMERNKELCMVIVVYQSRIYATFIMGLPPVQAKATRIYPHIVE